jgi:hypothetical protein
MNELRLDKPCRTKSQPEYIPRAEMDNDTLDELEEE